MSNWAILSIILFVIIVILAYLLYRESREKDFWEREANKEHVIKSALEYACKYQSLTTDEEDEIAKQLEQISKNKNIKTPEEYLVKSKEAIISIYKRKQ